MSAPQTLEFNPLDPALAVDPYPHYRRLRETGSGVHEIGGIGMYVLTRHDDVAAFYKDRRLEMRYHDRETARYGPEVVEQPFYRSFQHMAFFRDHGEHRSLRQMFAHAFTNNRVDALRARMREVADGLLSRKVDGGGMEFISEFCEPYPRIIIGEMLGIPDADNERIGEWALELAAAFEFLPLTPERIVEVNGHVESLTEYLTWLAEQRTAQPQNDLFSSMLGAAANSEGAITLEAVIANTIILYVGGHETTSGAMGMSLLALNRQPEAFAELKRDPELIPRAVEELLRFEVATQGTGRIAGADVEYGGVAIPEGSLMLAYIGSALRDPDVYPDPDRLDFHRPDSPRRISFAPGAHQCIGHMLARAEMEAFLEVLLRRLPDHKLPDDDPPYRPFPLLRGLAELPVEW